jgi:signal transduction histidine kinase
MDEIPARRDAVSAPPVLGDMEGYRFTATASMRVEDLHRSIKQADVPAVMIEDASELYGIIVASQLDALLSRPFVRELTGRKPVSSLTTLVDRKPLIMAADESIPAALELALHREDRAYEPVLVRDPSGMLTLVQIDTLLRAQARILDTANREKDALIDGIRRSESELRLALSRLRDTQDRLVQSEKMASLGHLVAGIAHEINTPIGVALTAVSHFGERTNALVAAFESNILKRNELRQYVTLARETAEMIAYNIGRAAQLIQSFKQVAIDQTGEQQRSFDLAVFLEQLIRSLRPDIRKAGLTIELICAEEITMDSFPGALGQVITNLVHNAMIHAYDRGSGGAITVTGELLPDGRVGLLVADSGRGMPPEVLAKVYDPFFTTRRGAGGSGLGMHIVFNLVSERLKGEIRCDSAVGEGTRFSLAIPRTVVAT